jgi:hypothetical protein
MPLALACIAYQGVYLNTTAVRHLLTFDLFREDPSLFTKLYVEEFIRVRGNMDICA